jgi:hypothetical protein
MQIEGQLRECHAFAEREGYNIVEVCYEGRV